jgi:predicted ATPase/DNA-binding CsgD family transcriptional regulator
VFPVPSLGLPAQTPPPPIECLLQYDAVRLFIERAQAVDANFAVTDAEAGAVAAICHRLDGLPLAIELAAARINGLGPHAMLARLERKLPLLVGGPRDAPPRLRAMRDAIAWSYDLLNSDEQAILRRLAVFAGGFTLEAAEDVSREVGEAGRREGGKNSEDGKEFPTLDARPPLAHSAPARLPAAPPPSVLDLVSSLVDKSLLQRQSQPDGEQRYAMLETIREFALEQLEESGEADEIRHRHAAWCLTLAEQAEPEVWGPRARPWLDWIEAEDENVLAALAWSVETRTVEIGLRLTKALWKIQMIRGPRSEVRWWHERLLSTEAELPSNMRATALRLAGDYARWAGDYEAAIALIEESLALARQLDNRFAIAEALFSLGFVADDQGQFDLAIASYQEALTLFRALGDHQWAAFTLVNLGKAIRLQGDYGRAAAIQQEALNQLCGQENAWGIAWSTIALAEVTADLGDLRRAAALFSESFRVHGIQGEYWGSGWCLLGLARIAASYAHFQAASLLVGASESIWEKRPFALAPYDRRSIDDFVAELRIHLEAASFAVAWETGRAMSRDQIDAEIDGLEAALSTTSPHFGQVSAAERAGLTSREQEVLRLLVDGLSDQEIAAALFISPRTAQWHVANLYRKLELRSRAAVAAYATRHNLV